MAKKGSLAVFGLGPKGLAQMTLEVLEALKGCDRVYGSTLFNDVLAGFCATSRTRFEALDWSQRPATRHKATRPGHPHLAAITREILGRLDQGTRVGLAVDGHPGLFCFAADLVRACEKKGHACRLYASIGALDQVLVALQPRLGRQLDAGLAVYSVLSQGLDTVRFSGDLGTLLYNAGHLFKDSPGAFRSLSRRLARQYGARHKVFLVECTPAKDNVTACALEDLEKTLPLIGVNLSVFIPAAPK